MDLKRSRLLGTIALTIPLTTLLMRGVLRDADLPDWFALGMAAFMAAVAYYLWPLFEFMREQSGVSLAVAWKRVAGSAAVALPLGVVIALGGRWFGDEFDPWLVLALLMLGATYAFVSEWHDTTIRRQPRWRA